MGWRCRWTRGAPRSMRTSRPLQSTFSGLGVVGGPGRPSTPRRATVGTEKGGVARWECAIARRPPRRGSFIDVLSGTVRTSSASSRRSATKYEQGQSATRRGRRPSRAQGRRVLAGSPVCFRRWRAFTTTGRRGSSNRPARSRCSDRCRGARRRRRPRRGVAGRRRRPRRPRSASSMPSPHHRVTPRSRRSRRSPAPDEGPQASTSQLRERLRNGCGERLRERCATALSSAACRSSNCLDTGHPHARLLSGVWGRDGEADDATQPSHSPRSSPRSGSADPRVVG